jgi:hypothetical protein
VRLVRGGGQFTEEQARLAASLGVDRFITVLQHWQARVERARNQAAKFSWAEAARRLVSIYREIRHTTTSLRS